MKGLGFEPTDEEILVFIADTSMDQHSSGAFDFEELAHTT
jgi:hypothetical protein